MNNLFSIFDPTSWLSLPLGWLAIFLIFSWSPEKLWLSTSRSLHMNMLPLNFSFKELNTITSNLSTPGFLLISLSLFYMILFNNSLGLLPQVFTGTSHLMMTLSLGLPLWLGHMVWSWFKIPVSMLSHLVPLGTPPALMPFMVCIELVSSIIRPLTLSVRLAANMIAGHLLLCLLSSQIPSSPLNAWPFIGLALLLLLILESAVALIQSFVFTILSTLYLEEVNSPKI